MTYQLLIRPEAESDMLEAHAWYEDRRPGLGAQFLVLFCSAKRSTLIIMHSLSLTDASEKLDRLVDQTAERHEPVLITGPRANAVLVGEEEWNAIQETLYLLSLPGMRESIRAGLATPIEECEKEPGW